MDKNEEFRQEVLHRNLMNITILRDTLHKSVRGHGTPFRVIRAEPGFTLHRGAASEVHP